jgi:hypothetical protein
MTVSMHHLAFIVCEQPVHTPTAGRWAGAYDAHEWVRGYTPPPPKTPSTLAWDTCASGTLHVAPRELARSVARWTSRHGDPDHSYASRGKSLLTGVSPQRFILAVRCLYIPH